MKIYLNNKIVIAVEYTPHAFAWWANLKHLNKYYIYTFYTQYIWFGTVFTLSTLCDASIAMSTSC